MELPDILEQASIWQKNHRHIMLYLYRILDVCVKVTNFKILHIFIPMYRFIYSLSVYTFINLYFN